ncbi:MAG: hypothetical protein KJ061_13240 [Vicinamibacteraceae bacterium]|nr:hypothetical protein [Vicinamibacteraceae bacterium]
MAGYENNNHNAWASVQIMPSDRLELFATTTINSASATIENFSYDAGSLTSSLNGLDFALHSQTMAGYSDLDFKRIGQTAGFHYRVTRNLMATGALDYARYDDDEPYLVDVTGRRLSVFGGLSWIF